jgi:hypothetical protein
MILDTLWHSSRNRVRIDGVRCVRGHPLISTLDGSQQRPYDTVLPLSQELGIPVDTSCQRDDEKCVEDVVTNYNGTGNVLVCWEHDELTKLVEQLGDKKAPDYPDNSDVNSKVEVQWLTMTGSI